MKSNDDFFLFKIGEEYEYNVDGTDFWVYHPDLPEDFIGEGMFGDHFYECSFKEHFEDLRKAKLKKLQQ